MNYPYRKYLDDCYYYYNSTCTKDDSCEYRHCEAALGSVKQCRNWRKRNCNKITCKFRHTKNEENRNEIVCFHEGQPEGCLKPHCVFKHLKDRNIEGMIANPENVILPVNSMSNQVILPVNSMGNQVILPVNTMKNQVILPVNSMKNQVILPVNPTGNEVIPPRNQIFLWNRDELNKTETNKALSDQLECNEEHRRKNNVPEQNARQHASRQPSRHPPQQPSNYSTQKPSNYSPQKPSDHTPQKPSNHFPQKPSDHSPQKPSNHSPQKPSYLPRRPIQRTENDISSNSKQTYQAQTAIPKLKKNKTYNRRRESRNSEEENEDKFTEPCAIL